MGTITVVGTVNFCPLQTGVNLLSIQVAPANPVISVPNSVSFTATGSFSDGSFSDITSQASWSFIGTGVSNVGPVFTCNQGTSGTVKATLGGINGTTLLTCKSVTFTPQGNLTAFQNEAFSQPFTASGGTPPYTFSSSDLPGWLSLSNTGCTPNQVNCNLNGTQASPSNWAFHVQATDSNNVTACAAPGCPITVTVVAVSGEDESYCTQGAPPRQAEGTYVGGTDNGAALPTKCVYDAVAATPSSAAIITVCPSNQKARADGVTPVTCTKNKIQDALNAANCGSRIYIYPNNYGVSGGVITATQNVYNESVSIPGTTCGPNDPRPNGSPNLNEWITTASLDVTNPYFPAPGTRITPAWAGQPSLPGRQPYPGPPSCNPVSDLNCEPNGNYVPAIEPTLTQCPNVGVSCPALNGDIASMSGWRFIGIEFFMQKQVSAPGVPGTAPGWLPQLIDFSCPQQNGKPACQNTGWQDIILDRLIMHACQFKDDAGCTDQMPIGVRAQNGNYFALINSFCYGAKTIGDNNGLQGPTDEGKCIEGGNVATTVDDGPIKIVNNYLESSSENFFYGGAVSLGTLDPADIEIRRNHMPKPRNWLVGIACPVDPTNPPNQIPWCLPFQGGSLYDLWVSGNGGTNYDPTHAGCIVDAAPAGGTNAACGITVSGGAVSSAYPVTAGSGYVSANMHPKACRYVSSGACITPSAPALTTDGPGSGSLALGTWQVSLSYTFPGGFETDFGTNTILIAANADINIAAPGNPPGFNFATYNAYACLRSSPSAKCTVLLSQSGIAVANGVTITTTPAGAKHNDASLGAEDGIYIVKNPGELKHGKRVLLEGNVAEVSTVGQSDQFGRAWEFDPTCQNQQCTSPQYVVRDYTVRYNILRYLAQGFAFSQEPPPPIAQDGPASIHDNYISMNGTYTTKSSSQFQAASGNAVRLNTLTNQANATNNIKINHNTFVHTEPSSPFGSASLAGGMNVDATCDDPTFGGNVFRGISFTNNIIAGGFKNTAGSKNTSCFSCTGLSCGSSRTAVDSLLQSFREGPVASGTYQKNIVSGVRITNPGTTCTGATATISGDGSGATLNLKLSGATVIGATMTNVGQNYSTATVVFSGGCNAVATAVLSGSGAASPADVACVDSNLNVTAGFPGEVSLSFASTMNALITGSDSIQTAQLDHPNSCVKPLGGGNIDVTNWGNVQFVNFLTDTNGAEIPTGDLHLAVGSPGHNAANGDNAGRDVAHCSNPNDIGACYDLVLRYTGCSIQNGVTVCPP